MTGAKQALAFWTKQLETSKSAEPHTCPICDLVVSTRSNCARHINKQHAGVDSGKLEDALAYLNSLVAETVQTAAAVALSPGKLENDVAKAAVAAGPIVTPGKTEKPAATASAGPIVTPLDKWQMQLSEKQAADACTCPLCDLEVGSRSACARHINKQHAGLDSAKIDDATAFLKLHHSTASFLDRWNAQASTLRSDAPHVCPICEKELSTRSNCAEHVNSVHAKVESRKIEDAVAFLTSCLSSNSADVPQPAGEKTSKAKRTPLEHWEHQLEKKKSADPHTCPICDLVVSTRSNCARHINKQHAGIDSGKIDDAIAYLYTQFDLHEGKPTSTKRRLTLSALDKWYDQVESKLSTDPHTCPICEADFSSRSNCVRHMNHVHDKVKSNATEDAIAFLTAYVADTVQTAAPIATSKGAEKVSDEKSSSVSAPIKTQPVKTEQPDVKVVEDAAKKNKSVKHEPEVKIEAPDSDDENYELYF